MFQHSQQSEQKKKSSDSKLTEEGSSETPLVEMLKGHEMVGRMNSPIQKKEKSAAIHPPKETKGKVNKVSEEKKNGVSSPMTPFEMVKPLTVQKKTLQNKGEDFGNNEVNSAMPPDLRSKMENSFATSFADVKIHRNDDRAANMGALAFTQGSDMHFAPGHYNPSSQKGQELIGHELAHVTQQKQGKVRQTSQKNVSIQNKRSSLNDDPSLEREADEMGRKASLGVEIPKGNGAETKTDSKVVQRYTQPITQAAPANTMSINDFISLVENEESKYSETDQLNTSLMITRIRKIFYGSESWDEHLIRGVEDIQSPYGATHERERSRQTVEIPGPLNDFDMVDTENYPIDSSTGNRPSIYSNQEVQLTNGDFIDLGHVFAGLDAFNHRHQVSAPILSGIAIDNVEGTTWVGDLGSVLAEIQISSVNKGTLTDAQIQALINEYASPQDMLGNIDAYAIAGSYNISGSNLKLSQILRDFYLGQGAKTNQSRRYQMFAQGIGLENWNGHAWSNENDRITHYTDQVNDSAALYVGAGAEGNPFSYGGFLIGLSGNSGSRYLVIAFLDALKIKLREETGR